jgi:hypothetical protein
LLEGGDTQSADQRAELRAAALARAQAASTMGRALQAWIALTIQNPTATAFTHIGISSLTPGATMAESASGIAYRAARSQ